MCKKILIIKLGYCETLVNEAGFVPSLGDVFRHTVLLHRYAKDKVTWLTSESAITLLKNNPFIYELITYDDSKTASFWNKRAFDEIICLEKAPVICNLAKSIKAKKRFGFGWNGQTIQAHPLAQSALDIANGKEHFLPIQALLYQMVGDYWRGEDYVLGYKPQQRATVDVGLNFRVGSKWPTKAWPRAHWEKLAYLCQKEGFTVAWQEGEKDIEQYMDWINATRLIVTCDSLGMHMGLAFKKKVIALFGPTPSENIYMYGHGVILRANGSCAKAPCMLSKCDRHAVCMSEIQPETIFKIILNLLMPEADATTPLLTGHDNIPNQQPFALAGATE